MFIIIFGETPAQSLSQPVPRAVFNLNSALGIADESALLAGGLGGIEYPSAKREALGHPITVKFLKSDLCKCVFEP